MVVTRVPEGAAFDASSAVRRGSVGNAGLAAASGTRCDHEPYKERRSKWCMRCGFVLGK
jgi:hypothetical protein